MRYIVSSEAYGQTHSEDEYATRREADYRAKQLRENGDILIDGSEVGVYTIDGDHLKSWRYNNKFRKWVVQ